MSQKWMMIIGLFGVLIASISILVQPIYFAHMVDIMLAYTGGSKLETVQKLIAILMIILGLNIVRAG